MTKISQRPLSATPLKGITTDTIKCNPEMFAMWLNDMVEVLNYTNKVAIDLYNENLETRKKVECAMIEINKIKQDITNNIQTVQTYEDRLAFIERQIGGSGGMMTVIEDKVNFLQDLIPMPIADIPKDWKLAGGSITKLNEEDRGPNPADIYYPIKKLFDTKANK